MANKYKIHVGLIVDCNSIDSFQKKVNQLKKALIKKYPDLQFEELDQITKSIPGAAVTISVIK